MKLTGTVAIITGASSGIGRATALQLAEHVLVVADRGLRAHPLSVRRALLEELASTWTAPLSISPVTADRAVAEEWSESMAAASIEGIVAKATSDPTWRGSGSGSR